MKSLKRNIKIALQAINFFTRINLTKKLCKNGVLFLVFIFQMTLQAQERNNIQLQETQSVKGVSNTQITYGDSLQGFNEAAIITRLTEANVVGWEYNNYLQVTRRDFINKKYYPSQNNTRYSNSPNQLTVNSTYQPGKNLGGPAVINVAPCVNEGFESTALGQVVSPASPAGWVLSSVSSLNQNNCSPAAAWVPGSPEFWILNTPVVNPIPAIANCNLFGGTLGNSPLGGSQIAQFHDFNLPYSLRTRLRQTFPVTANNALFQFAFAGAWSNGQHICCDQAQFSFQVYDCAGNALACANLSAIPSGQQCGGSAGFNNCAAGFGGTSFVWTGWQTRFMDLTPFIGSCVTVEFINSDCPFIGHCGTLFLDCLCGGTQVATTQIMVASFLTAKPTSTSICVGNTANLSVTGAASSYTWFAPPGSTSIGNSSTVAVSPTVTTVYTVAPNANGCISPITVTVFIIPGPAVTITNPTGTILCTGHCATLTASSNIAGTTWAWTPIKSTSNQQIVCPFVTSTFSLEAKSPNGCRRRSTVTISVNISPTVTASASPSVICSGDPSTLTASGASTYTWATFSPGSTVQVTPSSNTIYTLTGTATNNCTDTKTVAVKVLSTPVVTIQPPCICPGITNTLTGGGAMTFTWYIGGTSPATLTGVTITLNLTATTPFTLCGTANTCTACLSTSIPTCAPLPLSVADITLCTNAGSCTNIAVSCSLSPVNFTWNGPGITSSPNLTTITICPTLTTQNIYTVSATSPSPIGCPNDATLAVSIASNCCPQSTTGMTALTSIGGVLANTSYFLNTSQTLNSSASFQNSEVWITEDVTITVPTGMELNLDKVHLYACGIKMWHGIVVQDGGIITTSATIVGPPRNSFIEDAKIAIDLDNISLTNTWPQAPIDIEHVIFNKNHIGIKISNSDPALDSLALRIYGCVFASRDMTFTTWPSPTQAWPSNIMSTVAGDLRPPTATTTGLTPPYLLSSFTPTNLKQPYTNIPGQIGIKISKIGDTLGFIAYPGVMIGLNYSTSIANDFNLFDGLANGIDVTESSLTTQNNVFQNMRRYKSALCTTCPVAWYGGCGINHEIKGIMNARLSVKGNTSTVDGSLFWDCVNGIKATNVLEFWVRFNVFRSTHDTSIARSINRYRGDHGIDYQTNRFHFTVAECQFNNLKYGIDLNTPVSAMPFDVTGTGTVGGVYAHYIGLERNYFGPCVTSTAPYTNGGIEYMAEGIRLVTPNTSNWTLGTPGMSYILANRFDRTFRSLYINSMENSPLTVAGNSIHIEKDFVFSSVVGVPERGYGIGIINNKGNLAVLHNTIEAVAWYSPPVDNSVAAVYCYMNSGPTSPSIQCNYVTNSYYGFEFEDQNPSTVWESNRMCDHWAGLALRNNGVIGPQGSAAAASGNIWSIYCNPWGQGGNGPANWETYVENSDPGLSPLFILPTPGSEPKFNGTDNMFPAYSKITPPITMDTTASINNIWDCIGGYLPVPNWKQGAGAIIENDAELVDSKISIFPNPTNGEITIVTSINKPITVRITDISGREVLVKSISGTSTLDLSGLAPSIYIIELRKDDKKAIRRKLIKTE